jgi:hypothetical protein
MDQQKILEVVERYRILFNELKVPKQRMDTKRTMAELTKDEMLAHAHYLLEGVEWHAKIPGKEGKTGRHLASVQMILSFAGIYTIEDLMSHNRRDSDPTSVSAALE